MKPTLFEVAISSMLVPYCTSAYAVQYASVADIKMIYFPDAESFAQAELILSEAQQQAISENISSKFRESRTQFSKAYSKNGVLIGYLFIDEVIGKHELITYAVAFSNRKQILGVEILEYRENRGQEIEDINWRKQFVGLGVSSPIKVGDDIKNISGATLSCVHVSEGVKRLAYILEHADSV